MNSGTVYQRRHRDWAYSIYVGRTAEGKQIRLFKSGFPTKREADDARRKAIQEHLDTAAVQAGAPQTLGQLVDVYLSDHAEKHCAPTTLEGYKAKAAYLSLEARNTELHQLTTLQLEREMGRLAIAGGHHRRTKAARPLSMKTVRHILGLVSAALNNGVRLGILKANPAAAVRLPQAPRKEKAALDPNATDFFLSAARGHWLYPILMLAAATGCRRGELLALAWSDFDAERSILSITKSLEQTKAGLRIKATKTDRPRLVKLPAVAVAELLAHQVSQCEARDAFGPDYRTDLDLIFAEIDGEYMKPNTVTAAACLMAKAAGLEGISLHSLRHSHGSQLLSAGIPLPAVSKRLGHSSPRITAEVYSHALPQDEDAAASAWDALMKPLLDQAKRPQ